MAQTKSKIGDCQICTRSKPLTFHHLIPRKNHGNKWFRKRFTLKEMREEGVLLCRDCHMKLHELFDEKQLGREYNNLETIMADPRMVKFIHWIRKQK